MQTSRYIVKRILLALVSLFAIITITYIRDDVAVVEIDDFAFSEVFGCAGIRAEPFSKSAVALVDET